MNPILRDLLDHLFWADAQLWHAIAGHAPARTDKVIHDRLHHTHMVQRAFMFGVTHGTTPFVLTTPGEFASFDDLRSYARGSHAEMRAVIGALTEVRLAEAMPTDDASYLARELSPTFESVDLVSLPNYNVCMRLMIDQEVSRPFSAETILTVD